MTERIEFPNGSEFAFTILDDTDDTTLANGKPVYDLLFDLGFRTTKTVWAFDTDPDNRGPYFAGATLSDAEYSRWVGQLAEQGFEIAFHNATMGSSVRADTELALNLIEQRFGRPVRLHCNHGQNRENLFWGYRRYSSFLLRNTLKVLAKWRSHPRFEGESEGSPYYWADIAKDRLSYMRAFTFRGLNGRNNPPAFPYRSAQMPDGPLFFSTTDAPDVLAFNRRVTTKSIDRLRRDNGWAIVSTHVGKGFCRRGHVDAQFRRTMEYLARLGGWFVPTSELLDFLVGWNKPRTLPYFRRIEMEYRHVYERVIGRLLDESFYG